MSKLPPHLRRSVEPQRSFVRQAGRETLGDQAMMPDRSRSPSRVRRRETTGAGDAMSHGLGSHFPSRSASGPSRPTSASTTRGRSRSRSRPRSRGATTRGRGAAKRPASAAASHSPSAPRTRAAAKKAPARTGRPASRKSKRTARPTTSLKERIRRSSEVGPCNATHL